MLRTERERNLLCTLTAHTLTAHTLNSLTNYVNLREREGKAMTRKKETSYAHSRLKTKHMKRTNFHINSNILLTVRDKEK